MEQGIQSRHRGAEKTWRTRDMEERNKGRKGWGKRSNKERREEGPGGGERRREGRTWGEGGTRRGGGEVGVGREMENELAREEIVFAVCEEKKT